MLKGRLFAALHVGTLLDSRKYRQISLLSQVASQQWTQHRDGQDVSQGLMYLGMDTSLCKQQDPPPNSGTTATTETTATYNLVIKFGW